MGAGGLLAVLGAIIIYKLAEADNRRGWLWAGITVVSMVVLSTFFRLGMIGIYIGFVTPLAFMFAVKSTRRN